MSASSDDSENQQDSVNENSKKTAENEKESEEESQNIISSGEDDEIEILSSDNSQESFAERPSPSVVAVKDEQNVPINTVMDLKTEENTSQNTTTVKKEECKVKTLKEELLKEADIEGEMAVIKNNKDKVSQPQNGIEKKEETIEQKFKVNVRSLDDLVDHHTVNLINMNTHGQIDGSSNYLSQNGTPFPTSFMNILCDVCGLRFDSSELLIEHKTAMKHFKCSFKECEIVELSSQQELVDHQRLIHNILPSPVQQLAHQVKLHFDNYLK